MKSKKSSKVARPETLVDFEKSFPELWKAYHWLRDACDHEGPLDLKTRELVKVGIETACLRKGGLTAHIHRARKAGASQEEILQTILLATPLVGMPAVLDAFLVAKKALSGSGHKS